MADDIGGVWRTVGGRRIFIKDGEDLSTAMKESGKFKSNETNERKSTSQTELIDSSTEKFSNKIMNQNKESAIVFDDEGNEILFKDGERLKVDFKGKELEQLKGMNFTHNHPTTSDYDSMFSKRDLIFAYDNDLKSMITINQKGDIIKLERDKSIKFDDEHKPGFFAAEYQREIDKNTSGKSIEQLSDVANHMDNWMKENAEKYGYKYERKTKTADNKAKETTNTETSKKASYTEQELYSMNSRQLATLLVEDQIKRGVVKSENKERQIKARLTGSTKMSKTSLLEYAKKYL